MPLEVENGNKVVRISLKVPKKNITSEVKVNLIIIQLIIDGEIKDVMDFNGLKLRENNINGNAQWYSKFYMIRKEIFQTDVFIDSDKLPKTFESVDIGH